MALRTELDDTIGMEREEPRRRRRVKMARPVRVRPSSPGERNFEEVRLTVSASPEGLYFTTWRNFYYKGMRVFVTYPYSRTSDTPDCEYLGEVLSIDPLSPHRRGVAVRFLTTITARS